MQTLTTAGKGGGREGKPQPAAMTDVAYTRLSLRRDARAMPLPNTHTCSSVFCQQVINVLPQGSGRQSVVAGSHLIKRCHSLGGPSPVDMCLFLSLELKYTQ